MVKRSRRLISAMSSSPSRASESLGSRAALSGSKAGHRGRRCIRRSADRPRALMRPAKRSLTSREDISASPRPAIERMLRCLSSRRFSTCTGFSDTAAPATKTELTRLTASATISVRLVDFYWTLRASLRLMLAVTTKWSISGAQRLPNRMASMMPSGKAGSPRAPARS